MAETNISRAGAIGRALARGLRLSKLRAAAIAAILALVLTGAVVASTPQSAWAVDYPSWDDVAAVRNDQARTEALVKQIEADLIRLEAEAQRAQADAEAKGNIWQEADTKFQAQVQVTTALQEQADAANTTATESARRAGQWAAQLARSGGGDLTTKLLVNSGDADNLLYGLGLSSKISDQAYAIYERATLDKNTAQALTDQAAVARGELEVLKAVAEAAFVEAQAAAIAAAAVLEEQQTYQAQMQAQLLVLREKRAATEADYLAGVRARIAADASLDAGEISDSGWVRPSGGRITSTFGWRVLYGANNFHRGVDLAPGCGANIFAATSGTVIYAAEGWNGGYGNYIIIDHGGGLTTAYGHIRPGGILVSYGQSVGVGTNIAKVGTTGNSTGCHLHFEVRPGGVAVDPVAYLSNEGVNVGG